MFAKLFETELGQILIKIDSENDLPEVKCYFEPPDLGVCSISFTYEGTNDEMWDKAEDFFDKISEESAINIVSGSLNSFCLHIIENVI